MRASAARQISTADALPVDDRLADARWRWSVASSDDPGHAEQAGGGRTVRSVGHRVAHRQRRLRCILAFDTVRVHVRGRGDAGGIDGLHLLGVGQDVGELPGEELFLVGVSSRFASLAILSTSSIVSVVDTGSMLSKVATRRYDPRVHVRRTSVAGTWYPNNPARLVSEVDGISIGRGSRIWPGRCARSLRRMPG